MSSKGYHWYNNGVDQVNALECPNGYVPGMLRSSVEKTKEANHKLFIEGKIDRSHEEDRINKIKETKGKDLKEFISSLDVNKLQEEFIDQNLTKEELANKYNVSYNRMCKALKKLNISKPKSLSSKRGLDTKYKKYGSKEEYDKYCSDKKVDTILSKYNSLDEYYSKVGESVRNTKISLYGSSSYYNIDKARETSLERYGVEFPCMRKEARSASSNDSRFNQRFKQLLIDNNIEFEEEFPLENKSYDFKVGNILIEINPSATHNSLWGIHGKPKDKYYHQKKSILANNNGYRCIHLWDWDDPVKLISLLKPRDLVYARRCEIREVSLQDTISFLNTFHFQGYARDDIRIGLYYNNELISIMTFDKPRYNSNYEYELVRYCSSMNITGGKEKLFKYFIDTYKPSSIISYCDRSKFSGDTYLELGFKLLKEGKPSRHWYNIKTGKHITSNLLRQRGVDQLLGTNYGKGKSNTEAVIENDFVPIFDCGQDSYIYCCI